MAQALDPSHLELISLLSHAHLIAVPGHRDTRAAQPHEHEESYCWTRQIFSVVAEQVLVRHEEAGRVEKSTKTTVARRGIEKTSAAMATTEQVQEALQQPQLQVEQTRSTTAEQELENASIQTLVTTKSKGTKEAEAEERTRRWKKSTESGGSPLIVGEIHKRRSTSSRSSAQFICVD